MLKDGSTSYQLCELLSNLIKSEKANPTRVTMCKENVIEAHLSKENGDNLAKLCKFIEEITDAQWKALNVDAKFPLKGKLWNLHEMLTYLAFTNINLHLNVIMDILYKLNSKEIAKIDLNHDIKHGNEKSTLLYILCHEVSAQESKKCAELLKYILSCFTHEQIAKQLHEGCIQEYLDSDSSASAYDILRALKITGWDHMRELICGIEKVHHTGNNTPDRIKELIRHAMHATIDGHLHAQNICANFINSLSQPQVVPRDTSYTPARDAEKEKQGNKRLKADDHSSVSKIAKLNPSK